VNCFTDLGILINNKLTWDDHIVNIVKRANMRLGLIKRTLGYTCSTDVKLICYKSLVRPLLEFTSQVWYCNNKKLILKLESVQRRATKFILNDFNSTYHDRLLRLNLLPLTLRREFLDTVFFYNCHHQLININHLCLPRIVANVFYRTRLHDDDFILTKINVRYSVFDGFYTNRISRLWNTLPLNIRSLELTPTGNNTSFKRELKLWYFNYFCNHFANDNTCTWLTTCTCSSCRL
jgi:hypothetical protein